MVFICVHARDSLAKRACQSEWASKRLCEWIEKRGRRKADREAEGRLRGVCAEGRQVVRGGSRRSPTRRRWILVFFFFLFMQGGGNSKSFGLTEVELLKQKRSETDPTPLLPAWQMALEDWSLTLTQEPALPSLSEVTYAGFSARISLLCLPSACAWMNERLDLLLCMLEVLAAHPHHIS